MNRPPRVFVGTPCARLVEAEWMQSHLEWCDPYGWSDQGKTKIQTKYRLNAIAGRIDVSRSILFEAAKHWDSDAHVQVDADTEVSTPFDMAMNYAADCFDRGFDLVIWPTVAADQKTLLLANPNPKYGLDPKRPGEFRLEPWEVTGGAFGGVVFSRKCLRLLRPITEIVMVAEDKPRPMYCTQEGAITEDYSFCNVVRDQGMKVCADPRVIIGHHKRSILMATYGKDDPRFEAQGIPKPKPVPK